MEMTTPRPGSTTLSSLATSNQYPVLKVDFDGDGIATWQEFGDQQTGASE